MVAQAARRTDHDMNPVRERASLAPRVHPADAGHDAGVRLGIEPSQLALDLERQFPGRRDDEGQRRPRRRQALGFAEEVRRHREAEGHGLAGPGLGGDEEVAIRLRLEHGRLHGGRLGIVVGRKGARQGGNCRRKRHEERKPCWPAGQAGPRGGPEKRDGTRAGTIMNAATGRGVGSAPATPYGPA